MARALFDNNATLDDIFKLLPSKGDYYLKPLASIKSDISERTVFYIEELLQTVDESLLTSIVEFARKNNVWLENDWRS